MWENLHIRERILPGQPGHPDTQHLTSEIKRTCAVRAGKIEPGQTNTNPDKRRLRIRTTPFFLAEYSNRNQANMSISTQPPLIDIQRELLAESKSRNFVEHLGKRGFEIRTDGRRYRVVRRPKDKDEREERILAASASTWAETDRAYEESKGKPVAAELAGMLAQLQEKPSDDAARKILADCLFDQPPTPVQWSRTPAWLFKHWQNRGWSRRSISKHEMVDDISDFMQANGGGWDHWGRSWIGGLDCLVSEPYWNPEDAESIFRALGRFLGCAHAYSHVAIWNYGTVRGILLPPSPTANLNKRVPLWLDVDEAAMNNEETLRLVLQLWRSAFNDWRLTVGEVIGMIYPSRCDCLEDHNRLCDVLMMDAGLRRWPPTQKSFRPILMKFVDRPVTTERDGVNIKQTLRCGLFQGSTTARFTVIEEPA